MADRQLPPGWAIVSLHYGDERKPHMSSRPTDAMIAAADAIRVSYKPPGADKPVAYRTIHGATGRAQIGDLIDAVVKVASPV